MYRQGAKLVMGREHCYRCDGTGNVVESHYGACPKCKGTGKGPRGGRGGCKNCHGLRKVHTQVPGSTMPCERCDGDGLVPSKLHDTLPQEVWESLDFKVMRTNRGQGFMEAYIGMGCYAVTDYGDAWKARDDEALITKVREERSSRPQAIKVARYLCPECGVVAKPRWNMEKYDRDNPDSPTPKINPDCGHEALEQVWEDSNELVDVVVINVHPKGYTVLGAFYEDRDPSQLVEAIIT